MVEVNGLRRRIISVLAVSFVLGLFLVQPSLVASTSSPSRITEVIPIDVSESWVLSEKDITIDVRGFASVTASGDAYFSVTIRFTEQDLISLKTTIEESSMTFTLSDFTLYRELVAAYLRGEIDSPTPTALNQNSRKDVYTGPKYFWFGILMVAHGDPVQYIDFHHPDNYDTYYPGQWNTNWLRTSYSSGWIKWVHHHASGIMQQSIEQGTLIYIAAGIAAAIGWAIHWVLGAILTILAGLGFAITYFLVTVVQSEQLDGWAYTHDLQSTHQRYISFGLWRDWLWYVGQF